MRIIKNKYSQNWELERSKEMRELLKQGVIPYTTDVELLQEQAQGNKKDVPPPVGADSIHPWLCGQVAGMINDILPAKTIVENMV
eukprot:CAMPEP_0114679904 /NCGR_PEP_ID=MMETSP0191-20121206/53451_1 /TAXON_ID=126664 /ORGANISM="Sorites sp." /LENGTH=84 /DNA_ID=CAMNT_0001955867 /DNA_START=43 /DNA_END=294 /DNA_ORIENTATION=+